MLYNFMLATAETERNLALYSSSSMLLPPIHNKCHRFSTALYLLWIRESITFGYALYYFLTAQYSFLQQTSGILFFLVTVISTHKNPAAYPIYDAKQRQACLDQELP